MEKHFSIAAHFTESRYCRHKKEFPKATSSRVPILTGFKAAGNIMKKSARSYQPQQISEACLDEYLPLLELFYDYTCSFLHPLSQ
jgi:hypothetical protein